jgi:tetratricopeptide (TPR) repeat protein
MTDAQVMYQQALRLIDVENLEAAKGLLTKILVKYPLHAETNWTMGLLEAATGNPIEALERWSSLDESKVPNVSIKRELVMGTLEKYKEFYELYNEAIALIAKDNLSEAKVKLETVLRDDEEFPLPVLFYRAYLLLLQLLEDESTYQLIVAKLPSYVASSSDIKEIVRKRSIQSAPAEGISEKSGKNTFKIFSIAASIVLALTIGVIGSQYLFNQDDSQQASIQVVDSSELDQKEAEIQQLEQKVIELAAAQESELQKLEEKNEELTGKLEYHTNVLTLANLSMDEIIVDAATRSYKQGRSLFLQQNYTEAASRLQESYALGIDNYLADDVLYYLIVSYEKVGNIQDNEALYDEFLGSQSEHYLKSPYYDDVLLKKATYLVKQGEKEMAVSILDRLINDFAADWTGQEAMRIKQDLMGEQS